MKNFLSLRIVTLVLVTGYMLKTTGADADVTFLGVAAGDATTSDVVVWTRAKDEVNPQRRSTCKSAKTQRSLRELLHCPQGLLVRRPITP
jgi:phosphodiesterase/alkaline phosphatase D-like protein